jgi:hypothetical protein
MVLGLLSPYDKATINRLRKELVGATAKQLLAEVRSQGVDIGAAGLQNYIKKEAPSDEAKERMHRNIPYRGKAYSEGPGERFNADVAIMEGETVAKATGKKSAKSKFKGFLMVQDTFTREVDAEPIASTQSAEVASAMGQIMRRNKDLYHGPIVTTDNGPEFKGVFRDAAEGNGMILRARHSKQEAANDMAPLDSAMGHFKKALVEREKKHEGSWDETLKAQVRQDNHVVKDQVYGRAKNVRHEPVQKFLVLQDQAKNFAINDRNNARMTQAVREQGFIRAPISDSQRGGMTNRRRVYDENFGMARKVKSVKAGIVTDIYDDQRMVKRVLPVGNRS